MRTLVSMLLVLVSAVCLAQTPDSNQRLLEEMKGVRTKLDRVVQLMEATQKTQRALLASQEIQSCNAQIAALQTQQGRMATEERNLSKTVSTLDHSAQMADAGIGPNGVARAEGERAPVNRNDVSERLSTATQLLGEIHARQQSAEAEIIRLRGRISRLEKIVDEALAN